MLITMGQHDGTKSYAMLDLSSFFLLFLLSTLSWSLTVPHSMEFMGANNDNIGRRQH